MDVPRSVYSRDLTIAAMCALDTGSATGEITQNDQLSSKLLERCCGEWRTKEESAFVGIGSRCAGMLGLDDARGTICRFTRTWRGPTP